MLQMTLALALAADPVLLPAAAPAAVEETAAAPRWPASLFFSGGGITFWTGVGFLFRSAIHHPCLGCSQPDNTGLLLAGAVAASVGIVSMLVGVFWLVWTRAPAVAGS